MLKKNPLYIPDNEKRTELRKAQNKFKVSDGTIKSDGTLTSNEFNDLFTNIEPNLAKKIRNQDASYLHYAGSA